MTDDRGQWRRRRFLNWLLGGAGGAFFVSVFYPVFRFLSPPRIPEATTNRVAAGTTNDPDYLDKRYKIVRFGADPVIVVKLSETDFRAFSATCTHLDCIVEYRRDRNVIWCNCHNGQYDLSGKNVAGPPPRPLDAFTVNLVTEGPDGPTSVFVSRV